MDTPSANGENGRGPGGRFAKGNPGGPGNPHARQVGQIRAKLMAAITDDDIAAIVRTLIDKAKAGEQWAIEMLISRLIGGAMLSEPDPPKSMEDQIAELLR